MHIGSPLAGTLLLEKQPAKGILVAGTSATLLLPIRQMFLPNPGNRLALHTDRVPMTHGGRILAQFLPTRLLSTKPQMVCLSRVFKLIQQMNCVLEIPVVWLKLRTLSPLFRL